MLYDLLYPLRDYWFGFNVVRYITVRAALACFTAFAISLWLGPTVIRGLVRLRVRQPIRDQQETGQLYELHRTKRGTPTMGGLIILLAVALAVGLWMELENPYVWTVLGAMAILGAVGWCDDWLKLRRKSPKGLPGRVKLLVQGLVGLFIGWCITRDPASSTRLDPPFFKELMIDLGPWYLVWAILVIMATSNAVNLTDGLDGLAIGCVAIIALTYAVMSYITGHARFAQYLGIPYIAGAGELTIVCAAIVGAAMGFLWFNCHPATIFMGDVGSLALGGVIGAVALLIKKELVLVFVGGIFVMETLSVILQVASFRWRGQRIFLMSPLHHHFQLTGWPESRVTIRFWIVAIMLALATLSTLKLR